MYKYRFKLGNCIIEASTPEVIDIDEPYSLFLCDEEKADITFTFHFVPAIPKPGGTMISSIWGYDIYDNGSHLAFFYKDKRDDSYYAYRTADKSNMLHQNVFIPDEYVGMLWSRPVFNLIGIEDISALRSMCAFHSSYIDIGGSAVLFTAPSETGKSTQAELWRKYKNAEIINGDKSLLSADENGCFAHGLPYSGSSGICKNRSLPVKAIVRLGQAPENRIRKLHGFEAYKAVFEGCYQSFWSKELSGNISSLVEKITKTTAIFRFDCLPDKTAVDVLEAEILKI